MRPVRDDPVSAQLGSDQNDAIELIAWADARLADEYNASRSAVRWRKDLSELSGSFAVRSPVGGGKLAGSRDERKALAPLFTD